MARTAYWSCRAVGVVDSNIMLSSKAKGNAPEILDVTIFFNLFRYVRRMSVVERSNF